MRSHTVALAAIGALLALSCSSVRPVAIQDGDQCFRCRRPIIEKTMAAELMDGNRFASKFRTSGCMAKYLADHRDETGITFVTDYATGRLVRPEGALFVPIVNRDTGERDYRAYLQKADADAAAAELHSVPIDWKTVLEKARS